ncbi:MAG: 1-deoxy-D-xylulose-5-phosphate reductoisomerase [Ruminococcaceae bacterium]|nr:1-deoxy-D-xylulose-5-phosphate reductoisomerase [Oscillospiraceae bacterium]
MEQKNIAILGSTGSIGTQTIEVVNQIENLSVSVLAANKNVNLLEQQIRQLRPALCAVYDESAYRDLKTRVADTDTRLVCGMDGLLEAAIFPDTDTVVTSMMGSVGLRPTLAAIRAGKTIALANKETLVTAGQLVMEEAKKYGVAILPVDSEHSAIFQCLEGNKEYLQKILLTASGGPFFGKTKEELTSVTAKDALKHPNWSMGSKITIDSATLMNKGLEVLEAKWLFGAELEQIEVLVHRQSIIHSMVQFTDNSILAQLGTADMKLPIQLALTYPKRLPSCSEAVDFTKWNQLTFAKPDVDTFRCLALAFEAGNAGGTMPCVMNGANEIAVDAFLKGNIAFLEIAELVEAVMKQNHLIAVPSLEEIFKADKWARETARNFI